MAIENIHRLREPETAWERPFGELFAELEQPELLFSAAVPRRRQRHAFDDHVVGSLAAVEQVFPRLDISARCRHRALPDSRPSRDVRESAAPRHLEPATIRAFAENVGTPDA